MPHSYGSPFWGFVLGFKTVRDSRIAITEKVTAAIINTIMAAGPIQSGLV
jgi:hypothetical protein